MIKIEVTIKQKDKGEKNLSLLNLREEIVNFLYKDTVAQSTKVDLEFFILLFFLAVKSGNKTSLERILDQGLPKFIKLNEVFANRKGYLRGGQYRQLVVEHGLSDLFENDIFFILVEAILHIDEIQERYASFLKKHPDIERGIKNVAVNHAPKLREGFEAFSAKRIQNDRTDENGNTHDLSMSVYRTVRMRNSRNLDLNLQKYTSVREITSQSPVYLTFLQHVDPQIIFDLWDKYRVAEYAVQLMADQVITQVQNHIDLNVNLGELINYWLIWKLMPGANRNEKDKARGIFEMSKEKNGTALDDLTLRLVDSVLKAEPRRIKEIENLKGRIRLLAKADIVIQDKKQIKKLEERVANLENLLVSAKEIDDK